MTDVQRLAKELRKLDDQMFSVSDTADTLAQATEGLAKSIGVVANESKMWTAASRLLSGTGLWKLQNYLRGGIQLLTFYKDAQAKAIESQNESMKSLAALSDEYATVQTKMAELQGKFIGEKDVFDEAMRDNLELKLQYESMAKAIQDNIIDEEDARARAVKRTLAIYEYQGKQMQKLLDKRNKLVEKELLKEELLTKASEVRKAKVALKMAEDVVKKNQQIGKFDAGDVAAVEEKKKELEAAKGALKEQRGGFTQGMLSVELPDYVKYFTDAWEKKESIKENLAKIRDKLTLGAMSKLGKVAGLAIKYSVMFVLFLIGAFAIFSIIRKILESAEAMDVIMETISNVMNSVFTVIEGFMLLFSAFFGSGTFMERLSQFKDGIGKILLGIFGGLFAILLGVGKLLFGKLIEGIIGLYNTAKDWVIQNIAMPLLEKLREARLKLEEFYLYIIGKAIEFGTFIAEALAFIGGLPSLLGRVVGSLATMIYETIKGDGIPFVPFFAEGGVSAGGLAVVGEKGPELVNLPKGARVHSNAESRKMVGGNTIHVHVNGRLGASDSELRDIAKKVGRMVSAEINRSTSSSTNVRY